MTNKDAIKFLDQVRKILLNDKSWLESTHQPINEAFDMAISALISRQAAVDAVNDLAKWYCETYHETRPTVMAVIDMLERLPSEQLEKTQLSEEDTTSNCISRQAAIDILYNFAGCVVDTPNGDYRRAYEASRHELETLPSAQPNLQPTCNNLATDCISRQAAIEAINTWDKFGVDERSRIIRWHEGLEPYVHLRDVLTAIVNLPSAQPTQTDTSNTLKALDCVERRAAIDALDKEYRCTDKSDDWDGLETAMLIIENLPSAQPLTAYVISDEDGNIKCSNCGSFECWGNYCMNCGAKMEEVKHDER